MVKRQRVDRIIPSNRCENIVADKLVKVFLLHDRILRRLYVDELILDLVDYKNNYADMAAAKLLKKCSTSWEAFRYLQDRVHDAWIPDSARQQVRQIIKQIHVQIYQQREYSWTYQQP